MRSAGALVIALLLQPAVPVWAEDEEPNIEFFYPVVIRRPVIERELELSVRHEKGRDGRGHRAAAATVVAARGRDAASVHRSPGRHVRAWIW